MLKEKWYEFIEELCEIIEKSNKPNNIYKKIEKEIYYKPLNFKTNTKIIMKDIFGNANYSDEKFYEKYLSTIKKNIDQNDSIKIFELLNENMCISQLNNSLKELNLLYEFMMNEYDWATDSIRDLFDLLNLYSSAEGSDDTLLYKLIFKEMHSLIDRLKTEASVEITKKAMGIKRMVSYEENKIISDIWRNKMPQDLIFNGSSILKSHEIIYTKFEYDKEGWVTFEFENFDKILHPQSNMLYSTIKAMRNENEHSHPHNFNQSLRNQGIINGDENLSEFNFKVSLFWKSWIIFTLSVFLYFLVKISEKYHSMLYY